MKCILDNCTNQDIVHVLRDESYVTDLTIMNSDILIIDVNTRLNKLTIINCANLKYIISSTNLDLSYLKIYNCENLNQIKINKIDSLYLTNIFFYNRVINNIIIDCLYIQNIKNKTIFFSHTLKIKHLKLLNNNTLLKLIIPITILKSLHITNCKFLKFLQFYKNLKEIYLKNLPKLITIKDPDFTNITNIEINDCALLKYLDIDYDNLISFVINNCNNLQLLNHNLMFNNCKNLTLTNCGNIGTAFYINGGVKFIIIKSLNISKIMFNTTEIIKQLSITNCTNLLNIYVKSHTIDFTLFSNLDQLISVNIYCYLFVKFNIKYCDNLKSINCNTVKNTKDSLLTINGCPKLYEFNNYLNSVNTLFHNSPNIMINKKNKYDKQNNDVCSICLLELVDNEIVLDCKHVYHKHCLYPWYCKKDSCPLCRSQIIPYNNLMCFICSGEIFNNYIKFDCNHYYHTRCVTNINNYNQILNCCVHINKK